jgi:Glycosyl hydrolase family 26
VLVAVLAASVAIVLARHAQHPRSAGYQPPSGPLPPVAPDSLTPARGALFGAWVKPTAGFSDSDQESGIVAFEHAIGRKLAIDSLYVAWRDPMPVALARWDLRSGRIPMISWAGASSARLLTGTYDPQIRAQALRLKSLPGPVMLRYFPEMNNPAVAEITGSPAEFIAAWQHLYDVFASVGATNVHWVWNPSGSGFSTGSAQRFYPGAAYVNWIGADGYNWAPKLQGSAWRSFSDIFSAFYQWAEHEGKPLLVGEFGVTERAPGEKAAWFRQAGRQLPAKFPRIRAIVYFNSVHTNFGVQFDWKVTSSPAALTAFRTFANDPYLSAQPSM